MTTISPKTNTRPSAALIIEILRKHLPELQERYRIRSLGLFGSTVRGDETSTSDVDLLVEIDDPTLTLLGFVQLQQYLSDLLGVPVDLVEKDGLKPSVGQRVLAEVVQL